MIIISVAREARETWGAREVFSRSVAGGWYMHPPSTLLSIHSSQLHIKDEAINAGRTTSAWPCSDATGGFPARDLLSVLQPSDRRSPGHPAQDFAASSNAPTWKMPCPTPQAVQSLPERGLWDRHGHGDGPRGHS